MLTAASALAATGPGTSAAQALPGNKPGPAVTGDLAGLRADLLRVASQRIFFGHQSIGDNLLEGVRQLAAQAGVALQITERATAAGLAVGTLAHSHVAENTQPLQKLKSFEQAMGPASAGLDTALLKFCYIDFTAETDVANLFAQYQSTMARLRALNPGMRLVHVTAPLTTVPSGAKALFKRLLGRAPYGVLENRQREAYSQLLRRAYAGREPLFDLARIESSRTDGSPFTVEWQGAQVPALVPAYSTDGEHLNTEGQLRAARALIAVLANTTPGSTS